MRTRIRQLRYCTFSVGVQSGLSLLVVTVLHLPFPLLMDIQLAPELLILQTRPSRLCAHV